MWDSIISVIDKVNSFINDIVWGWPVIILILGTGILISIRTRFMQLRKFNESIGETLVPTIKSLKRKNKTSKKKGAVSPFEAFSAAISGTVGTGNIIGVISAILTGGPGAVLWMWISAFFGMITNYAENTLGMYFRKKDDNGEFSGGPFYYIFYGLKWKWLAYIAAVFCVLAAIGMSGVQTNKISGTVYGALNSVGNFENETLVKLIIGICVASVTALIILGGIKRIGKVASMLVPFMSLLFIILATVSIFMNITALPGAFALIFKSAFNFRAAGGGIMGYAFSVIIKKGMARGVFSNEAGLGSSVIAHSASETREPVKQGLWGILEVFIDTFIICTFTALTYLTNVDVNTLTGTENDSTAILDIFSNNFGGFGTTMFAIILPLFAFTTTLAWSYYGEKAVGFCFQKLKGKGQQIAITTFKVIYILLIVASSIITSDLIWSISDTCNGLMAIPNLISLVLLSGLIVKITKNYYDRKKGLNVEPMLSAYPELNEEFKEDLRKEQEEKANINEN